VVAAALIAPSAAASAAEPELVPNGAFDGGAAPWFTTPDMVADASSGALCVDVPGGTPTAWSSIVGVDGVPIVAGEDYDFSFTATGETAVPVVIRALVQQGRSPWNATYEANPAIGGDVSEFHFKFNSSLDLPEAQLAFQLGGADSDWRFCLDNVHIAAGEPAAPYVPETGTRVRVNQLGYLASGPKRATLISDATTALPWTLRNAAGDTVATGDSEPRGMDQTAGSAVHVIDFTDAGQVGEGFTLEADGETSYPFEIANDLYDSLRYDALDYFGLVRSGIEITVPGYERPAGHLDVAPNLGDSAVGCQDPTGFMKNWTCDYTLDVTGGWYDAGDHGKYVVNGGIAVYQLMSLYERSLTAPTATPGALEDGTLSIPEAGNGVPDVLDEARWELEWMLKMQVPAGEQYAGMVHHKVQDDGWTGLPLLPSEDPQLRQLHRPSTAATLNLAAVAAQGARLFEQYDPDFSATLLAAARSTYAAALATPDLYAPAADGDDGGGPYDDDEVGDEFYWAAAELYLTTGEAEFESALQASEWHSADLYLHDGFNWGETAALGRLDLATVPSELADRDAVQNSIVALADDYLADQDATGFGQAFDPISGYDWGSNSAILNNQVVIATAFDLTGAGEYAAAVIESMDYLLGRNAMNNSYITGYGTVYSHNQHSRWFAHQLDQSLPAPPPGTISGGPNSGYSDPLAVQTFNAGCAPQQCYLDDIQSYSTNEMTVNWNSALAWVASFVDDQRGLEQAGTTAAPDSAIAPIAIGAGAAAVAAAAGVMIWRRRRTRA
jgi:endoglucanase